MIKKKTKLHIILAVVLMVSLLVPLAAFPVKVDAATNKAVRIKVSYDGKKQVSDSDWDKNTYSIYTQLPKTSKVKSGMTVSYKFYLPKTLLKKNGDTLLFCMDLNLFTYDKKAKEYSAVGAILKTRWCQVYLDGKKVKMNVYNETKDKIEKNTSKYASIKTQGKYYVITMKDVLGSTYFDYKTGKDKKINTKTAYTIAPEFVIHGDCSKLSGYVYLDQLTVNAVKKQTVTYNKKDYAEVNAIHYGGKDWTSKWKIVSI